MEKGQLQNGTSPGAYPTRILKPPKTLASTVPRCAASRPGIGTSPSSYSPSPFCAPSALFLPPLLPRRLPWSRFP